MLKHQGIKPDKINTASILRRQLGRMIGNAISQNVLEFIIIEILLSMYPKNIKTPESDVQDKTHLGRLPTNQTMLHRVFGSST